MAIKIALINPEIPPNTGNIARLCVATNCELHLVMPLGFSINDRHLKRAGLDYWEHLKLVLHDSLSSFLEQLHGHYYFFLPKVRFLTQKLAILQMIGLSLVQKLKASQI